MSEITAAAATGGREMTWFGIITIIIGILAIAAPSITGLSVTLLVGLLVLAGGIARMIWAFRASSIGGGLFGLAIGGLTLLCGVALLTDPLLASGVLTIILAAYLVVDGVFEIVAAFRVRPSSRWVWPLVGGILSFLLGFLILQQFPLSGAWAIGVLLGFKLLLVGMAMIAVGPTVRSNA
jgi:uncharacterized membrane protein HdeD (DUF308 family)